MANLPDVQFKTLVVRMLRDMFEYGCKIEDKVKSMQIEMKRNVQGINSEERKLRLKSTVWSRRKK